MRLLVFMCDSWQYGPGCHYAPEIVVMISVVIAMCALIVWMEHKGWWK